MKRVMYIAATGLVGAHLLSLAFVGCTTQHRAVVRDTAALLNTAADLAEVVCADIDDPDLCAARCLEEAKKQP